MLVLDVKELGHVTIGDVTVKIMKSGNGKTKLGIIAPRAIPILRADAKKREPDKEKTDER